MKLVCFYSKSVSWKNSNCVDFVRVQVKHTVQNWLYFLSRQKKNEKKIHIWQNGIQGLLKYEISQGAPALKFIFHFPFWFLYTQKHLFHCPVSAFICLNPKPIIKYGGVGQSRSLEIFICMPKRREPMVIRSTFLFSHWNRESKTDGPVIISSLAFNSGTKISSD